MPLDQLLGEDKADARNWFESHFTLDSPGRPGGVPGQKLLPELPEADGAKHRAVRPRHQLQICMVPGLPEAKLPYNTVQAHYLCCQISKQNLGLVGSIL